MSPREIRWVTPPGHFEPVPAWQNKRGDWLVAKLPRMAPKGSGTHQLIEAATPLITQAELDNAVGCSHDAAALAEGAEVLVDRCSCGVLLSEGVVFIATQGDPADPEQIGDRLTITPS